MGSMTRPASDSLSEILTRLDARIRRVDEPRWLSSRYAPAPERAALTVLYAFYYELARVRLVVSDQTLGQIRYQWWRDALTELAAGAPREHDVVLALADQLAQGRLDMSSLRAMVDQHETAWLQADRGLEPEALLAKTAARIFQPAFQSPDWLDAIAPDWARLRRGEAALHGSDPVSVPSPLRPALAHLRLRRAWARDRALGPLRMRLSILLAVLTGKL